MNIFITGATGFLGKSFLSQLLPSIDKDDRVFILLRKQGVQEDGRITKLFGSLKEIDKFGNEILDSDYFFHLAANPAFGSRSDYDSVNYQPTAKIVDILRGSNRLNNFIFISTIGAVDRAVDDDCKKPITIESRPSPISAYGKSKLKAERCIIDSGIPYTIIRPAWVYGENMRFRSHINQFVSMAFRKSIFMKFNFPGRVSLIHVDDLSGALVNSVNNSKIVNKIYFAAAEALSIGGIFSIIYEKVNNTRAVQVNVPRFHFALKRLHRWLPLSISNLFLDYLYAMDDRFFADFNLRRTKSFFDSVDEVISTNINNGYWMLTGANSGIGNALSEKLEGMNKKTILIDKEITNLPTSKNRIIIEADLSNYDEIVLLAEKVKDYKIFCLINNAGVGFRGSLEQLSMDKILESIDVNIRYPMVFTKLMLNKLMRDHSNIVNISSSIAYNPLPYMSLYSASKSFLSNWSESLTYEFRETNRVITFSPAGTYTNFQKKAGVKIQNAGRGLSTPECVADKIIKAVYGRKSVIILGLKANLLLWLSRLLPRRLNIYIWGNLFGKFR